MFRIGDQVRIDNLEEVEVYDEDYDEYITDPDQPYIESEMWDLFDNDEILTVTRIGMDGNIYADGYWFHPNWLILYKRKPVIELTGVNATSNYKVVIAKVIEMEMNRKEKGYAF